MGYQNAIRNLNQTSVQIGTLAKKALLEEVYTTPKPGLVDLYSCGAHSDMDIHTFERSASALHPWFMRMAEQGRTTCGTPEKLFEEIRKTGLLAEQAMYQATGGVNTHKGLIFTLGIFCASAGRCLYENKAITIERLVDIERQMTEVILTKELEDIRKRNAVSTEEHNLSHGERNLKKYGTVGVRGEAIAGYPLIVNLALPVMRQGLKEKQSWNRIKLQTLLVLMSQMEDSNILSRQNPEMLQKMHTEAEDFLRTGGAYTKDAYAILTEMDHNYIERNMSPGGCADSLAVTIFLEMITQKL